MSMFGQELIESLTEAVAHAEERNVLGVRLTTVEAPDIREVQLRPEEIIDVLPE